MAVTRREATIRNAFELYEFCSEKLTEVIRKTPKKDPQVPSSREFFYVRAEEIDMNRGRERKTVPGTMQLHSVMCISPDVIKVREISCVCETCRRGEATGCREAETVPKWKTVYMKKTKVAKDQEENGK